MTIYHDIYSTYMLIYKYIWRYLMIFDDICITNYRHWSYLRQLSYLNPIKSHEITICAGNITIFPYFSWWNPTPNPGSFRRTLFVPGQVDAANALRAGDMEISWNGCSPIDYFSIETHGDLDIPEIFGHVYMGIWDIVGEFPFENGNS